MNESSVKQLYLLIIGGMFLNLLLILWTRTSEIGKFSLPTMDTIYKYSQHEEKGFQDVLFSNLLRGYKMKHNMDILSKQANKTVPTFLLYTTKPNSLYWREGLKHISNGECALPCNYTTDLKKIQSVDAVLIFIRHLKDKETIYRVLGPRNPKQPWIMLSYENHIYANNVYRTNYHSLDGLFNRTMNYRRDSDVVFNHGFVVSNEDAKYLPESWYLPVNRNYSLFNKTMAVGMISNCGAKSGRLDYVKELSQMVQVDIYGRCGKLKCGGPLYTQHRYKVKEHRCFKMVGTKYLFYLAFENSICNDYVTEKIYNILYYPIIPVVLGAGPYADFLPPHSYIDATFMPPDELARLMLYLSKHPRLYFEYFKWKDVYKPSTIGGVRTMCHLCHRLHDREFYKYKVIEDFYDWFVNKSECINGRQHPPWVDHQI